MQEIFQQEVKLIQIDLGILHLINFLSPFTDKCTIVNQKADTSENKFCLLISNLHRVT